MPVTAPGSRPVAVPLSDETLAALPRVAVAVAAPAALPAQAGETVPPSVLDSVTSVTDAKRPGPLQRACAAWQRLDRRVQMGIGAGAGVVLLALALVLLLRPRHHAQPAPPPDDPVGLFKLDPKQVPQVERRAWMPREFDSMLVAVLGEHRARLPGLSTFALRPDGKKFALGGPLLFLADAGTLHRDDDVKGMAIPNGGVYALAFSGNGKLLVTGGGDRTVRLWNGETGAALGVFDGHHEGTGVIRAVAITRDGSRVISGGDDNVVRVWDVASRKQVAVYKGHLSPIRALAITPDGSKALSVGSGTEAGQTADNDVQLWDLKNVQDKPERRFKGHTGQVWQLAVSPDGKQLLAAGSISKAWVWDLIAPETPAILTVDPQASAGATFLPDGRIATVGMFNCLIKVWKKRDNAPNAWEEMASSSRRAITTSLLAAYPDSRRIAYSDGTTIRVWDIEDKKEWHPPIGQEAAVSHLAFAGDRWLLAGGVDRWLHLWDLETGQQQGDSFGQPAVNQAFSDIALSTDSLKAYTALRTNVVRSWETRAPYRNLRSLTVESQAVALQRLALSPDGKRLLAADQQVSAWDLTTAASDLPVRSLKDETHVNPVRQLGFLTDDAHPRRAWAFDGTELRVWDDIEAAETPRKLPVSGNVVAVGQNFDLIYAGAGGGVQQYHDLGDKRSRPRQSENRHERQPATVLALSPDGGTLFSAGGEHVVWWERHAQGDRGAAGMGHRRRGQRDDLCAGRAASHHGHGQYDHLCAALAGQGQVTGVHPGQPLGRAAGDAQMATGRDGSGGGCRCRAARLARQSCRRRLARHPPLGRRRGRRGALCLSRRQRATDRVRGRSGGGTGTAAGNEG